MAGGMKVNIYIQAQFQLAATPALKDPARDFSEWGLFNLALGA